MSQKLSEQIVELAQSGTLSSEDLNFLAQRIASLEDDLAAKESDYQFATKLLEQNSTLLAQMRSTLRLVDIELSKNERLRNLSRLAPIIKRYFLKAA